MQKNDGTKTLHHYDAEEISTLLTGRRIVAVEQGEFKRPDQSWGDAATGKLILDDGNGYDGTGYKLIVAVPQ